TARALAGLPNTGDAPGPGAVGEATLAGLRIAHAHDMSAPSADAPATDSTDAHDNAEQADAAESVAADSVKDEPAPAPSAD
ncbi:NADH-quinone oxidoreductase subunit E, partial [Mycobacterium sp. ITM-2017-0098]